MPKSKRCSECGLTCRRHNQTSSETRRKALSVTAKIAAKGHRKPVVIDQEGAS